jgi:hypothetical protein
MEVFMQIQKPGNYLVAPATQHKDDPQLKALVEKAKSATEDKFLSAQELKLNELQREGLIKALDLFESKKATHFPIFNGKWNEYGFNMGVWRTHRSCGSVCCIGGWAEALVGEPENHLFSLSRYHEQLHIMFFRYPRDVTPDQAAKVLRYFLETGVTDWNKRF